jgi:hypothetical protein
VTGGRVFGYDNIEIDKHVERVRNADEAAVVQRIFALCATGSGYSAIAKTLNAERAVCPRPQQDRPAGWSPSTVRDVLHRDLYRGVLVWNRTKKRDRTGDVAPSRRDPSQWVRVERPDLGIISDDEWNAAHARIQRARASQSVALVDRLVRGRDRESKYLLAGFARCASCGGTLSVLTRQHGKRRVPLYGCLAYHKRGPSICANGLVLPVTRVDDAVLAGVRRGRARTRGDHRHHRCRLAALQPENVETNVAALKRDLRVLDERIKNLTLVSAQGGADIPSVIAQLRDWQQEREALLAEIAAAQAVNQIHADRPEVERKVQAQVAAWRALVGSAVVSDGRQLLKEMLEGPLRFTPEGKTYRFVGPVATGRLIAGIVGLPPNVASPTDTGRLWIAETHRLISLAV